MSMKTILQTIKKHKTFIISTHVNPDPDALGSQMATALFLKSLGKKVIMLNEELAPTRFHFLKGTKQIKSVKKVKRVNYDAAIIVDCGDLDRIGGVKEALQEGKPIINIDHHVTNTMFGDFNLVVPKASSTAEVLFDLFKLAKTKITNEMAVNLYSGIMTDTGSFRYENTTAHTFEVVSELRKHSFSAYNLYRKIYETIPLNDVTGFVKVLSNVKTIFSNRVVSIELSKVTLAKFSEDFDLRDTVFKFFRAIKGVEAIVIFSYATAKETRVNLRSTGTVDVAEIAYHFNGGGHKRASGCKLDLNIADAKKQVLKYVKAAL